MKYSARIDSCVQSAESRTNAQSAFLRADSELLCRTGGGRFRYAMRLKGPFLPGINPENSLPRAGACSLATVY